MEQVEEKAPCETGSRRDDDMFVVGIGASAGGLEALQQFFRFMPSGSGLSFVVIQHLAPDYKSLMADILGKYTQMTVLQAEDGMAVEKNTVYLIPPKKNITYHMGMEALYTRFLEKFMPASLVLNAANSVIHFFGNYMDYVSIAPGKASFNLFSIINKDLSLAASTALSRSRAENSPVTYTDIPVDTASGHRHVDLSVYPIRAAGKEDSGLTAMIFSDSRKSEPAAEVEEGVREKYDIDTTAARRITDLEQELQESQEDLRKTIGELETVNEELQAANEELLTANEELQSSNEELQSVNEELYTVNTEYQQKVDELTMMTNDLSNFLSSTMIGILFVDGNLNIRKFTEYIGREFQLMEQDVGRSIQIFAHSFPYEKIVEDARTVLKTLAPIDREVVATNGQYYTLRIAPYRTTENSIKGLVITIIDSLETDRAKKQ